MEPLSEDLLGNPDSTAEHVVADIGMSSLLKGPVGDGFNPKNSPFSHIPRLGNREVYQTNFPEEPERAAALTELNDIKKRSIERINGGVKTIFGQAKDTPEDTKADKEPHELYEHIADLAASPESLLGHLANQTAPISMHAQNTTIALSKLGTIASKIIQGNKPNTSGALPMDLERQPSPDEISKFNKLAGVLDNPLSILSKAKKGTLSDKDVDVVKQVYPNLFANIQETIFKSLVRHKADEKPPLDYKLRSGLSKLLGQPIDSSFLTLGSNQIALGSMSMTQKNQEMMQSNPSKSGMGKMKFQSGEKTRAQQSLERKPA